MVFAALSIGLLFLFFTFYSHERAVMEDAKKRTQCVNDILKKTLAYESEKSVGLFTFFDNNQNVKSAFAKKDKKALYDEMLPIYQNLNKHFNITHIYFFEKDGRILLRVHEYEKSGDYPKRKTLQNVVNTGQISSGIEFGIHRNLTHRTVKPYYINGHLEGYIEIGKEIDEIMSDVSNISRADTVTAIKRSVLKPDDFEKWKSHQKNPRFYADTKNYFLISSTVAQPDSEILGYIDSNGFEPKKVKINDRVCILNSIPLIDAGSAEIGRITTIVDVQEQESKVKETVILSTLVAGFVWVFTTLFFYRYYSRMERKINAALTDLYKTGIVDGLTGVYNRRYLNETVSEDIQKALKEKKKIFFIMLDIDFFKKYNDIYGHHKGDDAIKAVARAIIDIFDQDGEKVYRLGGEEFGALGMSDDIAVYEQKAFALKNKVQKLQIEHKANENIGYLTVSIGMYVKNDYTDEPFENIYKSADALLYRAKENGRNRVESNL